MYFNASDYQESSSSSVQAKLNLSQLVLTGPMTSIGINNSAQPLTSSSDINLTGNAKISMGLGAGAGKVLTSDSSGNGTWQNVPSIYNPVENSTVLQGNTFTTNITNSTDITTLNLSCYNGINTGFIKLGSGSAGHVLTSDSTGLLSLQSIPSIPNQVIQYTSAVMTTGNTINAGNPNTLGNIPIGTITLAPGTYMIFFKFGFKCTSTLALSGRVFCAIGNILESQSFDFLPTINLTLDNPYQFHSHQFIYTVTTMQQIQNCTISFRCTQTSITATTSQYSHCYAIRLS